MDSNLIIVEGLPASGKSTTAAMIANYLLSCGRKVVFTDEGTKDHPADFDNYDFPDFAVERALILDKWRNFVRVADKETVYVFNCLLLQNPMSETMMRFGMTESESQEYIAEIADLIRPLNPLILYLYSSDIKSAIERVCDERGEDWLNAVTEYHIGQGYGKENRLTGFDGYIECLRERQARELRILRSVSLRHTVLQSCIGYSDISLILNSKNKSVR